MQRILTKHTVLTVNTAETVGKDIVALDTVGFCSHQPDLLTKRSQRFVSDNQKDVGVHRGKAAALQAMSFIFSILFI